jgi:hypothetical protein
VVFALAHVQPEEHAILLRAPTSLTSTYVLANIPDECWHSSRTQIPKPGRLYTLDMVRCPLIG